MRFPWDGSGMDRGTPGHSSARTGALANGPGTIQGEMRNEEFASSSGVEAPAHPLAKTWAQTKGNGSG